MIKIVFSEVDCPSSCDEAIDLAPLFGLDPVIHIVGAIRAIPQRDFTGDLARQMAGIEMLDAACARLAREHARPAFLDPASQWRHQPETRHDDTAHALSPSCSGFSPRFGLYIDETGGPSNQNAAPEHRPAAAQKPNLAEISFFR